MNELALFAGAGGGILGGGLLGWRTVCAVEWEQYPASVLCARQNDGLLPTFPIWDDVQTFDGKPWRGIVDVVSGGFPCQDISAAGKGAGIEGGRSSMWKHMARIIGEIQPRYAFVENSPMLTTRGLGTVLGDLASLGFNAEWGVLSAADVGANHLRERIWIVAKNMAYTRCELRPTWNTTKLDSKEKIGSHSAIHNQSSGEGQFSDSKKLLCNGLNDNSRIIMEREKKSKPRNSSGKDDVSNSNSAQRKRMQFSEREKSQYSNISDSRWWEIEPNVGRVADGVAASMDRLKAIGNGQVPLCAATAFKLLQARIDGLK